MTHRTDTGFTYDVDETTTANKIKRAVGCSDNSWLYLKLPRHADDKTCPCYSCVNAKRGWWDRPSWVHPDKWNPAAHWHRWVRWDIGARNVRLTLTGGEHFVIVAVVDMPRYAAELCLRGVHGKTMALYYYGQAFGLKNAPRAEAKPDKKADLETRRQINAKRLMAGW